MGKRGPAPRPTALKLLHGERHLDRINPDEPQPRPADLTPPEDAAPAVLAVWRRVVAELEAMNLAFPADADCLRGYCEAVVSHRRACEVLARSGVLVKGLHGNLVRNPALQIQRDAALTMLRFAQEFGLTPSARSSIRAAEATGAGDDNPFAGSG
ncbi:phage terminase small subunit P27 family [Pseudonocardia acaciae]|uniref:phage terminase small subunit P27 family n=1 Tax=Pseudonocardia acaciae TaxID=551276 RepID=UPI0006876B40|nr:phage terminase small subunit P27 family [Pseudonocardia acaciae]